jgi:hypothetical protein
MRRRWGWRMRWRCDAGNACDVEQVRNYHMGFMELPRSGEEGPQLVLL